MVKSVALLVKSDRYLAVLRGDKMVDTRKARPRLSFSSNLNDVWMLLPWCLRWLGWSIIGPLSIIVCYGMHFSCIVKDTPGEIRIRVSIRRDETLITNRKFILSWSTIESLEFVKDTFLFLTESHLAMTCNVLFDHHFDFCILSEISRVGKSANGFCSYLGIFPVTRVVQWVFYPILISCLLSFPLVSNKY